METILEPAAQDTQTPSNADPFADMFAQEVGGSLPDPFTTGQGEEGGNTSQVAPEIDAQEKRIRDFQSKYDQSQVQLQQLQSELEQVQQLNPIAGYINSNPALARKMLDLVDQDLSQQGSRTGMGGGPVPVAESTPLPEEPQAPPRPSDFDEYESLNEKGSASWNYRKQMEQYRDKNLEYRLAVQRQTFEDRLAPIVTQAQIAEQNARQQAQVQNIYQNFTESGFEPQAAQKAMVWASRYAITPEDIMALYRAHNNVQATPQQQQASPQRVNYPLPAATAGNGSVPPVSAEDSIFNQMLDDQKRQNPWG